MGVVAEKIDRGGDVTGWVRQSSQMKTRGLTKGKGGSRGGNIPAPGLGGNPGMEFQGWVQTIPAGSEFKTCPAFHSWVKACGWLPT